MYSRVSIATALLAAAFLCSGCPGRVKEERRSEILMGTEVSVVARGADESRLASGVNRAFAEMGRIENIMSGYDAGSELSRLNAGSGAETALSPEMLYVLMAADLAHRQTKGAFDPTVGPAMKLWARMTKAPPSAEEIARLRPSIGWENVKIDVERKTAILKRGMSLDLDGIAKGYAAEMGLEQLRKGGASSGLVNAGGDVSCFSTAPDSAWKVGVRNPRAPSGAPVAAVEIAGGAIATSGGYERHWEIGGREYPKIIDPSTLYPARSEVISASAFAESAALADAWATAALVMGKGALVAGDNHKIGVLIILSNGRGGLKTMVNSRWRAEFGDPSSP